MITTSGIPTVSNGFLTREEIGERLLELAMQPVEELVEETPTNEPTP